MNSPTNETGRDALAPAPPVAGAMGLYSRDEENLIADVMNESGATRAVVIQELMALRMLVPKPPCPPAKRPMPPLKPPPPPHLVKAAGPGSVRAC